VASAVSDHFPSHTVSPLIYQYIITLPDGGCEHTLSRLAGVVFNCALITLTLLVRRLEGHPACN